MYISLERFVIFIDPRDIGDIRNAGTINIENLKCLVQLGDVGNVDKGLHIAKTLKNIIAGVLAVLKVSDPLEKDTPIIAEQTFFQVFRIF